jgi:hypothetical protein
MLPPHLMHLLTKGIGQGSFVGIRVGTCLEIENKNRTLLTFLSYHDDTVKQGGRRQCRQLIWKRCRRLSPNGTSFLR